MNKTKRRVAAGIVLVIGGNTPYLDSFFVLRLLYEKIRANEHTRKNTYCWIYVDVASASLNHQQGKSDEWTRFNTKFT